MSGAVTRLVPLENFCATGSGGTPSRSNSKFYGGDIPWVKSGELRENVIFRTEETITAEALKQSSAKLVPNGAILLAMYGATVGRLATLGVEAATNQAICNIRPDPAIAHTQYIYRALEAKVPELIAQASGGAQPNISQEKVRKIKVPLPPLDEQKRIAAILDKADQLRQKRRQAVALLNNVGSALIDEITTHSSSRLTTLGECLSFVTSGGRNWSRYYAETGDRFIRSLDVQMNSLSNEEIVRVQAPDNAEARRTRTQIGDVLLTITGSRIGRVAALKDAEANSYVSQHVAILRPITSKVNPEYLSFFLSSSAGQRQIAKWQYGQTKPGLNFDQIRSFELPDVDREIQMQFVSKVHAVVRRKAESYNQGVMLDNLFSSLQHRAFSGQL
ncbi:restriction endonuclease subunit S [Rhizobium bangladeshense]|uniref:restriction endonuclease subunit S n=1 Tax=Rhizobium bangladeshense TaxID=1138189 RepID=UPI001C837C11|nr:restriction endonuclease subunit S [Rhizobium bangladeshense]MBX4865368.1 restriction endonuclease subunit S [Rhizobium bangladeshense]MBX4876742.1 restriction endonuclease subunit S [Rhizobium bangladeshense]